MAGQDGLYSSTVTASKGVQQSGVCCVLIQVSFWLDLAHIEDEEDRFLVCVSQAGMRLPV